MEINFASTVDEKIPGKNRFKEIAAWCCSELQLKARSLNLVVLSDEELRIMHQNFLDDNTVTDVMTFNLSEDDQVEGEIYMSLDRAKEQALQYAVAIQNELARLIIHGCLHLAGYDDHQPEDRKKMKLVENKMVQDVQEKFL